LEFTAFRKFLLWNHGYALKALRSPRTQCNRFAAYERRLNSASPSSFWALRLCAPAISIIALRCPALQTDIRKARWPFAAFKSDGCRVYGDFSTRSCHYIPFKKSIFVAFSIAAIDALDLKTGRLGHFKISRAYP
jgi:hypothetical protein